MALDPATLFPAVTVHGLSQAHAALAPGLPVLLLSAPGAAAFAGAAWWRAMIEAALSEGPTMPDALDCGPEPGRALEALHLGCRTIILEPCPAFAEIVRRAAPAQVLAQRPAALDLAQPGAARLLLPWLRRDTAASLG